METHILIFLWSILGARAYNVQNGTSATKQRFPEDFLFGVATSAYQIEGAWNIDGKGWSMWDFLVRNDPDAIMDKSNGDVAANSYELYERDVEMLTELGVNTYRFSISWPRILPNGRADYVNPLGVAYYNDLIDRLLENGITPFVTMYHWDLPQNLSEQGGWMNEDIVDWFGDYARVLFENFGDRVKHWLTINEPYIHCKLSYDNGMHAPRIRSPGKAFYDCGRNILLANARAFHIYKKEFKNIQDGKIGLVFSMDWPVPDTNTSENLDAIASYFAFNLGQYADPIFTEEGDYPQLLVDRVAQTSFNQGYNESRLRSLTQEEVNYIKGTSDFFALNHYSNTFVYRNDSLKGMFEVPSVDEDAYYMSYYVKPSNFKPCRMELSEYAPGFYNILRYIKEKYNNPIIYVTENGKSSGKGLYDYERISYLRSYISAMLGALNDGVNVKGYFVWNLMDDFGWDSGYTTKHGLYEVDMNDPARTRTPRKSAFVYKEIIRSRTVDFDYDPDLNNEDFIYKIISNEC